MSQSPGTRQQTAGLNDTITSQGFDTTPTNNVHRNLNLFFPSDGLGLITKEECDHGSSGESLSQVKTLRYKNIVQEGICF